MILDAGFSWRLDSLRLWTNKDAVLDPWRTIGLLAVLSVSFGVIHFLWAKWCFACGKSLSQDVVCSLANSSPFNSSRNPFRRWFWQILLIWLCGKQGLPQTPQIKNSWETESGWPGYPSVKAAVHLHIEGVLLGLQSGCWNTTRLHSAHNLKSVQEHSLLLFTCLIFARYHQWKFHILPLPSIAYHPWVPDQPRSFL